ncbi:MAG TPA: DUF362 domain-containing protein [Thermoleophilia bacterium]|nr:DUF362 domain-containing protein [Thermoleophilia bacterium]
MSDPRSSDAAPAAQTRRPAIVGHVKAAYGPDLPAALERACAPFGGFGALVKPGERIGVKVNLLRAAPPEKVVTTHPESLRAVLRALKAAGATPFVGDSPGGPGRERQVRRGYEVSGMAAVCREEDVELLVPDTDVVELATPAGRLFRSFPVGRCWTEADGIVQVGPLKTHGLMRLTGAVKLTFGCVTGLRKGQLHVRASERGDFADMLLDLHLALAPRLSVIDAIVAMQGKGPGSGTPRAMGSLFAATDGSALDAALADLTVHERRSVYTLAAAERRGLIDIDDPYRLDGDPLVPDHGFEHSPRDAQDMLPPVVHRLLRGALTSRPRLVDESACTRCGDCAQICGASAITLAPTPVYDDAKCVRCYACTEICPTAAIQDVRPLTLRLLRAGR